MPRETVTILKAAELTGVSRRTIYNWMRAKKVEFVRTAGGNIRIFADTLWTQETADDAGSAAGSAAGANGEPGAPATGTGGSQP